MKLGSLWKRPFRLPHLASRPPRPGDPLIYSFNNHRDAVIAEVTERVVHAHQGDPAHLERILNDAAMHETRRLQAQGDSEAAESLSFWSNLYRRVARLSDSEKRRMLRRIVSRMAQGVAGNFDPRVHALAERAAPKMLTGIMNPTFLPTELAGTGSHLDMLVRAEGPLESLRRLSNRGTLVFVPTHSSNLDSVVLGYALARAGLPPLMYGAGKNLFSNPVLSFFMHNLGAYQVDRRVQAQLYKEVLKAYACVVIEKGFHSLFFPGGTRSRSNQVENRLKLGLAGSAVEAFSRRQVRGDGRPVWFVPTTINYDLVLEAESLIEDHLREKGKARYIIEDDESSQLDRWIAFLRKLVGLSSACVIRFGSPIDPFGNSVDDIGQSIGPQGHVVDPVTYVSRNGTPELNAERDRAYTQDLAETIVDRFRRNTVIMPTQLVAHVLYRHLVQATPGMDVFGRVRERGTITMGWEELEQEVGNVRDAIVGLEERHELRIQNEIRTARPNAIVHRALEVWNGYHTHAAARVTQAEVVIEDPSLTLYYQNRLAPWAEQLADDGHVAAAREIQLEGRR
ncbi:MAG: 1-acyl-sn-glycerol-3-phosphate acyltransferase [Myxococcales bacterium]|nr:1-acyl-sn-glycerol-3-phosphate acyltransferase [Myxococcales bacterium]